jgi:biotin operon repressor
MQLQLPFFPTGTKLINDTLGFREQDGIVFYLHNGNPIYSHLQGDHNGFRFILANLVVQKLCKIHELCRALGIGRKNVERYVQSYQDHGASYFFERKETRGQCYKMTPEKLSSIQSDLDIPLSIYRTAKNHDISEAAINYHIKNGNLKKTPNRKV